jgi:hypothetical protein
MSSYDISGFAPRSDAWWNPKVGDIVAGEIIFVDTAIRDDFDKKGGKELQMRIDLAQDNGQSITLYVTPRTAVHPESGEPLADNYTKRDAQAIFDAVRRVGKTSIETGARLAMQRLEDQLNRKGSGNPARDFYADYQPPAANRLAIPPATPTQPLAQPINLSAASQAAPAQVIQSQPMVHAQNLDYTAISAATGVPEAALRVMTAEQIALLPVAAPAQSTPSAVQALSGLLSQPNG